jgi:anaerobic glycerol-3-phosphate dehydrogenase
MALTLPVEQRLGKVSLVVFFNDNRATWLAASQEAHQYLAKTYAVIRPDDVAKILLPVVEANEDFKAQLAAKKLTQKYWFRDFVDLIIDRTWQEVHGG